MESRSSRPERAVLIVNYKSMDGSTNVQYSNTSSPFDRFSQLEILFISPSLSLYESCCNSVRVWSESAEHRYFGPPPFRDGPLARLQLLYSPTRLT